MTADKDADVWAEIANFDGRLRELELGFRELRNAVEAQQVPRTRDGKHLEDRVMRDLGVLHENMKDWKRAQDEKLAELVIKFNALLRHLKTIGVKGMTALVPDEPPTNPIQSHER